MRLGALPQTYRSFRRARRIFAVLFKYGFDDLVERLGLASKPLPFVRRHPELRGLSTAQRFKLVCEELGPTFIKFGQLLSTRSDLLSPEWVGELKKLQDKVPPMPREEVRQAVELALGRPLPELFAHFSLEAKAAASIAQVHEATLPSGRKVMVKLQRPYIERLTHDDSGVMMHIAQAMERHGLAREFDPVGVVEQFRKNIKRELDFTLEGQNMDRMRADFAHSATFRIPEVIWSHSGRRCLTLERIEGVKVSERERLLEAGHDLSLVASRLVEAMARQIITHGLFHADPHPGNIFVLPGGVICLLDYGQVGRIDEELTADLIRLAAAAAAKDGEAMVRALLSLGAVDPAVKLRALKMDLLELVDRYSELPLGRVDFQVLFEQFMTVVRSHRIAVPPELLLLAKALVLTQATCRDLDPAFEPLSRLSPLIRELAEERLTLGRRLRRLQNQAAEVAELMGELPREARFLLRKLQRNQLVLNFEHRGLERLIFEMDRSSNRLSFSLIIAALIVGSSIVLETYSGPTLLGLPLLPLLGFLAAGMLGFWLVISILRSGRF